MVGLTAVWSDQKLVELKVEKWVVQTADSSAVSKVETMVDELAVV